MKTACCCISVFVFLLCGLSLRADNSRSLPAWYFNYSQAVSLYNTGVRCMQSDPSAAEAYFLSAQKYDVLACTEGGVTYAEPLSMYISKALLILQFEKSPETAPEKTSVSGSASTGNSKPAKYDPAPVPKQLIARVR